MNEYVRFAAGGEKILETDQDRVIAELGAIRNKRCSFSTDNFLADAIHPGNLTPPTLVSTDPPATIPIDRLDGILDEIDDSRYDR